MNKKLFWLLIVFLLILTGCQNEVEENIEEYKVPITDEKVVSPALPEKIVVNNEEVNVSSGEFLKPGDYLKISDLVKPTTTFDTMENFSLNELNGYKVIHIVPSLDTPICSLQTRQLNYAATELPDVHFITVSADLPFALNRFVDFNEIKNMKVYSDFKTKEFFKNNKLFLEDYQLATRAIMVLNDDNKIMYIEYAEEVTEELDLYNVINFVRQNHKN